MIDRDKDRIDLAALDPTLETGDFDKRVAAILAQASVELATRRTRSSVIREIARWHRPMLTAAAASIGVLLALIVSQVISTGTPAIDDGFDSSGIAEAIGIPSVVATWVREEATPSLRDLYALREEP